MKLYNTVITVIFVLTQFSALMAGPKEDYDKVEKDLIEALAAKSIAQKAWFDYKQGKKFPATGAEEQKKVADARLKLKEAIKSHPDLKAVNKEVAATQETYGVAKKAKIDAMVKKAPKDKLDGLKAKERTAKMAMFATMKKQTAKSKDIPEIQKLKAEVDSAASQAESSRYASDPQAKSLFTQRTVTTEKCASLRSQLNDLKSKIK